MRRVAALELTHLPQEVDRCCMIYLPHVGYLLAFPPSPDLDASLSSASYALPGLHFMFKTADMVFYKSDTCYGECCAPILKHFPASLPLFQKLLSKLTRVL